MALGFKRIVWSLFCVLLVTGLTRCAPDPAVPLAETQKEKDLEFEDGADNPLEDELFIGLSSVPEEATEPRPVDEVDPYIGTLIPLPDQLAA